MVLLDSEIRGSTALVTDGNNASRSMLATMLRDRALALSKRYRSYGTQAHLGRETTAPGVPMPIAS